MKKLVLILPLLSIFLIAAAPPPDQAPSFDGSVTVAQLKELYGKPLFHVRHDPPKSESLGPVTITYDEEISFEYKNRQLTYYFLDGKYQARGFGDLPDNKPLRIPAKVVRVIDGDTIVVRLFNGTEGKVRYIGIDTPETKHPNKDVEYYGKEATEANKRIVDGKEVELEPDVQVWDKYGRLLAYVYVDDLMVNEALVRQGYARVSTYPPNVRYQNLFLEAERKARESKAGLWREEPAEAESVNDSVSFVASKGSDVFHKVSCPSVEKIRPENLIRVNSLEAAEASGRRRCKRCFD